MSISDKIYHPPPIGRGPCPEGHVYDFVTNMCVPAPRVESDPNGTPQHEPGAKLDAGKLRVGLIMTGFPNALAAVAEVATYGAAKYTEGGWLHVPNGQARYTDAMYRHLLAEHRGEQTDEGTGIAHAAHTAWNALARLELLLRKENA